MELRIPFRDVYFTGMVRDKQGRKMSKSLGNSPDLLMLIEKYGADAVRFGIMISSPAGNDLLFDEAALEQGRNFNNKIWNALKLVKAVWKVAGAENSTPGFAIAGESQELNSWIPQPENAIFAIKWFRNKLNKANEEIDKLYQGFRLSEALKTIYSLIWDDFCSWYLEWIKPEFGQPIDHETFENTILFFEELMQILHPFMPFITEEVYHLLKERKEGEDLCIKQYSKEASIIDEKILQAGEIAKNGIATIRDLRTKLNHKSKDIIYPKIKTDQPDKYSSTTSVILKMTNSGSIDFITDSIPQAIVATSGSDMIYLPIPISNTTTTTTTTLNPLVEQRKKLQEELNHHRKFLETVQKKLDNERFMQNAKPEVIETEMKKKTDALSKIKAIEESLLDLG
jgi:valyl-tRNA synthetase